MSEESILR